MATIADLAVLVRSKNAGPFWLTIDIMFDDEAAYRRVRDMSYDDANDYLMAKNDQARFFDPENGREQGLKQFLDEKRFRPGLGGYKREG